MMQDDIEMSVAPHAHHEKDTTRSDSRSTSISDHTAFDPAAPTDGKGTGTVRSKYPPGGNEEHHSHGIFSEPGTIPLPDAGYHHLGVVFEGLTVHGTGGTQRTVEGLEISVIKALDFPGWIKKLTGWKTGPTRPLVSDFVGVCPDGETMLVLGRPGAGCSTLLRAIANSRAPFVKVEGDVMYSSIDAHEAKKFYDGEIVFNSEEDNHIPLLTVGQTLDVGLSLKKPAKLMTPMTTRAYVEEYTSRLLKTFGMPHTRNTFVGNEYVRGVSGGERKRVSLSEMLCTNAAVVSWDNCIRGLDSAVALHFLKALKELSLSTGMANIVSIYQASQEMYDTCFDRVVVIYEGGEQARPYWKRRLTGTDVSALHSEMVFSGRTTDAQNFFIEQGWEKKARQTTPDFLTSCTSVTERKIRDGHHGPMPQTPREMADYFKASPYYGRLQEDISSYKAKHASGEDAKEFRTAVAASKHRMAGKANGYKVNFFTQVGVLIVSQFRLQKADPINFIIRIVSNVLQATLVGAVCYKPASNASGAYTTAGAVFFAILYFIVFSFGEIPSTVMSRPLLIKHRTLGFYNPAAFTIAQMVSDTPVYAIQNRWASWMRRISVPAYALEALLANEFRTRTLECSDTDMVPSGSTYTDLAYQGCSITGGVAGSRFVSGNDYLRIKYEFLPGNICYVIYAVMVVIGSSLVIKDNGGGSSKIFKRGAKVVNKDAAKSHTSHVAAERVLTRHAQEADNEMQQAKLDKAPVFTFKDVRYTVQVEGKDKVLLDGVTGLIQPGKLTALSKPLEKTRNGDIRLTVHLSVQWELPVRTLGAGKTTLLDTSKTEPCSTPSLGAKLTTLLAAVSQRKTVGKVEGEYLIDGRGLDSAFSRKSGFVQQGDIHEPFSTVRECLQFSALLRQSGGQTREERLQFAEEIIDLLELGPIADALVGNMEVGGLGVEERKRVPSKSILRLTIGVELAAAPDFLLFLDERTSIFFKPLFPAIVPEAVVSSATSGLDSQAAFEITRFLKKIAASGIAVIAVIHQPSGDLFEMFDSVVILAPGGKTVYAGPCGHNAKVVTDYFGNLGSPCPPDANPIEHIISTVAPVGGTTVDWPGFWKQSAESQTILRLIAEYSARNSGNVEATVHEAAFAVGFMTQLKELIKRNFRAHIRDGPYYTTKLALFLFLGLFVGFYCFELPSTIAGIEASTLCLLVLTQVAPPLILDIAINFQNKFNIYIARERNGIYSWTALTTALIICEIPILLAGFTLFYLCYYWTAGFGQQAPSEIGGLEWLLWMVFAVFTGTCGTLLGAVSPTPFSIPFSELSFFTLES
ncbi:hypothetical protein P7C70_g804, partial [Phenoliferia sp. Uapishka_3]